MRSFINRNSYLIATALAMGAAWVAGVKIGGFAAPLGVLTVGAGMAAAQRLLRGGASSYPSWIEARRAVGKGRPVLLFLYSDT